MEVFKGDARSLDYSSYELLSISVLSWECLEWSVALGRMRPMPFTSQASVSTCYISNIVCSSYASYVREKGVIPRCV